MAGRKACDPLGAKRRNLLRHFRRRIINTRTDSKTKKITDRKTWGRLPKYIEYPPKSHNR